MRIGITATNELVFKMLFGSPRHSFLTLHFLNDLLPLVHRPQAATVTITNPYRLAEFLKEKEISVDVRAQDETTFNPEGLTLRFWLQGQTREV